MTSQLESILLYSLIIVVLSSCSIKKIAIQVADPPKYQISPEVKSIAILNRSLNANFKDRLTDSPEDLVATLKENTFYDSSASDSALISASRAIFNSQRFDVVVPYQRDIWREDKAKMLQPLDTAFIKDICRDFKVDAVLVMEDFFTNS